MTLKADGSYMPQKIPHIFYRKFGFSTFDKKTDKNLDKFIANNLNATSNDFPCLLMHYPPQSEKSGKFIQLFARIAQNCVNKCKKNDFTRSLVVKLFKSFPTLL